MEEKKFWGRSIAVYRDHSGKVQAIEDRCAHRQLKLSMGEVKGCNLVCMYHGWEFGCDGKLISVPTTCSASSSSHSGVIVPGARTLWADLDLPGNPDMKDVHKIPDIPELEGPESVGRGVDRCDVESPPLDDHRQRQRLYARPSAPQVQALLGCEDDQAGCGR